MKQILLEGAVGVPEHVYSGGGEYDCEQQL